MIEWLHPGLLLMAGALVVPFLHGGARKAWLLLVTGAALADCLLLSPGTHGAISFLDYTLVFGRVDRLSLVFAWVFALITFIGTIYALHIDDAREQMATLIYAGAALGAVFAGDLLVLYLFWELMALASVTLIWLGRNPRSTAAGFRYLLVHLFGGVCLLGGILFHHRDTGSLAFDSLSAVAGSPGFALILIGFILNAAVPPLSAWLSDAYPEASVTGTVFLSAFTTKTAVYVLARAYAGTTILIWLGAVMAIYGIVYALLENDIRRLLSYHIISQVGYMVCGIGIGTDLALNGAVAHAFAHILYKALLLMGAGAIIQMTGRRKLTELGGLGKAMPLTLLFYMIAGFSISGVPLFSGFVSKSMIVGAAGEEGMAAVWLMLTAASCGTFLSTTLKLPWFAFFGEERGIKAQDPPRNMLVGMGLAAALCVAIGIAPGAFYRLLPVPVAYAPYTAQHVVGTIELLLATALVFFLGLRFMAPKDVVLLDTDRIYRAVGRGFLALSRGPLDLVEAGPVARAHQVLVDRVRALAPPLVRLDRAVIVGGLRGVATGMQELGEAVSAVRDGNLSHYLLVMAAGLLLLLSAVLLLS